MFNLKLAVCSWCFSPIFLSSDQLDLVRLAYYFKDRGLEDDALVTISADNLSAQPRNWRKFANELDLRHGLNISFRGTDASVANFEAVLLGDKKALGPDKKTLPAKTGDHLLVVYVGHGLHGSGLSFPTGWLPQARLTQLVEGMRQRGVYGDILFLVAACHAGHVFARMPKGARALAICSARANEASYTAPYPYNNRLELCLAGAFVSEVLKACQRRTVAQLHAQVRAAMKRRPKKYASTPSMYGDRRVAKEDLSLFLG